jgi:hypothetical protein
METYTFTYTNKGIVYCGGGSALKWFVEAFHINGDLGEMDLIDYLI